MAISAIVPNGCFPCSYEYCYLCEGEPVKTIEQVNEARAELCNIIAHDGAYIDAKQTALLAGMLNALVWVADGPDSSTLQRLLDGEPLALKQGMKK